MITAKSWPRALLLLALSWIMMAGGAAGQVIFDPVQDLDFDDPEAWAMKFFTSASLQTSLGPVPERKAFETSLGLELITIPHLDREQRTVGFGGFKEEDLNRAPAWARLRAEMGLGAGWGLVLGWSPPVEFDGAKANLVSLALEKSFLQRGPWSLGARLYGQIGQAKGDFTCTEGGAELFQPGSDLNPFGCEGPSDDEIDMRYVGLEIVAGYQAPKSDLTWHGGVSVNSLDMEFQVDARTFGFIDRTLLRTDGDTFALTAGVTWEAWERSRLGAEIFYSPLDVNRRGGATENDDLLNLRLIWRWRAR